MILQCPEVYLTLSFLVEQAAEQFIRGVFEHQHGGIGDKRSQVDFEVERIEVLPEEVAGQVTVRTLSPVVVSVPLWENGHRKSRFLSPEDAGYGERLLQNLIRKYESYAAFTGTRCLTDLAGELDWQLVPGRMKSSLVTIKAHTPQETKVRGFSYAFRLTAPVPLMRIGLLAGFGEKNSLGFGCVEPDRGRHVTGRKGL